MTQPAISQANEKDALSSITRMLVGTSLLRDQPGVVYSLAAAQAHPADAQAVDQFMQGLDAEKQVSIARASGAKINLSDQQQTMLTQNNVTYNDVLYTQQDQATALQQRISDATGGAQAAKLNPDGSLYVDPTTGQVQVEAVHQDSGGGGFWGSIGDFFGGVGHDLNNWVLKPIGKGYNFVATTLSKGLHDFAYEVTHPGDVFSDTGTELRHKMDPSEELDMRAQGYDPTSFFSNMAYYASGHAHKDLSPLISSYGADKVSEAVTYLEDPVKFRTAIESDPANYVQTPDGQTALTPDAKARLVYLGSKDFETLARQVNAHDATIGNDIANSLGIDPIDHPDWYTATSVATNLAASFLIDPTLVALKAVKVAKLSQVGIDTLGDSEGAASILTRQSSLPWVKNVQRGWQSGIDYGTQMREAIAAGDVGKQAALTAEFGAKTPALAPLGSEFIGEHALQGWRNPTVAEKAKGITQAQPIFGPTGGINTLDDAAEFVRSKLGLSLLQNGRAGTQAGLMPGALSAFGYRKLKGITASWMTGRSAARASDAAQEVLSRAAADPLLAKKLIDDGMLMRLSAEADDAVIQDGVVLAEKAPADTSGLPSAARAGRLAVTPGGAGDIAYNLRRTGDPLADASALGRYSPTAVAARSRLAAQRFSTLLPRNTMIDIADPRAGDIVYKYALTYLNRGDANTLRALWNAGDGGARKAIIGGLIDQVGHAAGLGRSATGQEILNGAKTAQEAYSAAGSEIELAGQRLALFEGQTRDKWLLPSFQSIQKASAKVGLWEATFGRALTSGTADMWMGQWKMGALFKPSTATRNMLEGSLRAALSGTAGSAIKARALLTARNKELWDRGLGVADRDLFMEARGRADTLKSELKPGNDFNAERRIEKTAALREQQRLMDSVKGSPVVMHLLAKETGDTELARQIERGSMLSGDVLGRSTPLTRLADMAPLALTGRAYRYLVGKTMDQATLDAALTMGHVELSEMMEGYGQQILASDLAFKHAANEATAIAKVGFGPAKIRYSVHRALSRKDGVPHEGTVWTNQALDGTHGADAYATALAQRVNGMPGTARAALDYIDDPSLGIEHVVKAMEQEKRLSGFGRVYFDDPIGTPNVARRAVTDDEVALGKRDWAQKVVDEYAYLLTGQNMEYQSELSDFIRTNGVAPDGNWIADHLTGDNRPESALAPAALGTLAMPAGGLKSLPATLQDVEGGAYQWMVERPLQRLTSSPVLMANYAIARKGLNGDVKKLIEEHGLTPEAANGLAKELSVRNAWVKTEQLIDDPGQKTQFDVIARNMFPFSRATQAMIRRWGTGLWQNPAAARKMMLSYEGAVHSGFIYQNAYGEPTFTYPGSGAMNMAMRAVSKIPGFGNVAAFPVASSMTGGVLMSVPGADNPLRMSMGPMIAIPLREVYEHLLPTSVRGDAMKLDEFINGPVGTGQTFSTLVPTAARRFFNAFSVDDRNSALASSMNGAFANLAAAGLIPPPDAPPSEMQAFQSRLQGQVRSQLFLRFAFGLFAPAAPSQPGEGTAASGSDYAWSLDGLKQLSDEYKAILNETGGDIGRATAVFTALHPDEVVYDASGDLKEFKVPASAYETARSAATASGAYLPSTESTLNWLNTHGDFVKKFGAVAAYFLPEGGSAGEPFSDAAYQAQIEFGLRQRKTPGEFINDVYVRHAESAFYPTVAQFDTAIASAKSNGDTSLASQWSDAKVSWEAQYKALNPLLGAKLDNYGAARSTALGQLADLRRMLSTGQVPDGQAGQLRQLVTAYDNYEAFIGAHPGGDNASSAMRAQALAMVNAWATQTLTGTNLAPLFDGVFRVLNSNFDRVVTAA